MRFLLLTILGLTLTASAAQDVPTEPALEVPPEVERRFEVATIGSGAPEVLAWFGPLEPDAAELTWRRALVDTYRKGYELGSGRVHVVMDLGPSGPSERAFSQDFPSVLGTPGPAECLTRFDSRALAQYLVANPKIVGIVRLEAEAASGTAAVQLDLQSDRTELVMPRDRSLRAFRYFGLGLREVHAGYTLPAEVGSVAEETSRLVREALDLTRELARARIQPAPGAVTHLGGELWQLDLVLAAPELHPERPDSNRTYPTTRLSLSIVTPAVAPKAEDPALPENPENGSEPAVLPAPPAAPELVELAWRAPGAETFARLVPRGGAFGFPDGDLPNGVTLRLVVRLPETTPDPSGTDQVEVLLDAARAGYARCVFDLGG